MAGVFAARRRCQIPHPRARLYCAAPPEARGGAYRLVVPGGRQAQGHAVSGDGSPRPAETQPRILALQQVSASSLLAITPIKG